MHRKECVLTSGQNQLSSIILNQCTPLTSIWLTCRYVKLQTYMPVLNVTVPSTHLERHQRTITVPNTMTPEQLQIWNYIANTFKGSCRLTTILSGKRIWFHLFQYSAQNGKLLIGSVWESFAHYTKTIRWCCYGHHLCMYLGSGGVCRHIHPWLEFEGKCVSLNVI